MTESQQHLEMFASLIADGPLPELAEPLSTFGQFVGSWELVSEFWLPDGSERQVEGVWIFDWILDGRGIQDVLLMQTGDGSIARGTTTRVYDPAADDWKVAWLGPVSRNYVFLVGGPAGDRIVLLGHISTDGGDGWRLEQRMTAHRRG